MLTLPEYMVFLGLVRIFFNICFYLCFQFQIWYFCFFLKSIKLLFFTPFHYAHELQKLSMNINYLLLHLKTIQYHIDSKSTTDQKLLSHHNMWLILSSWVKLHIIFLQQGKSASSLQRSILLDINSRNITCSTGFQNMKIFPASYSN